MAAPYSAQSSGTNAPRAGAAASRNEDKYFCANGQHYCKREDFTQTQLLKSSGIGRNSTISCRNHTKGVSTELKCMGYCERVLPLSCFSKAQRSANSGQRCLECVEYQLSFEPGRKALPPPGKHQREHQEIVDPDAHRALPYYNEHEAEVATQAAASSAASSVAPDNQDDDSTVASHATSAASRSSTWTKSYNRRTEFITPAYLNRDADLAEEAYYTDGSADEC